MVKPGWQKGEWQGHLGGRGGNVEQVNIPGNWYYSTSCHDEMFELRLERGRKVDSEGHQELDFSFMRGWSLTSFLSHLAKQASTQCCCF